MVTDAATGQPLPGVNIVVKDQYMGAASDADGYFVILNLLPGVYTLEAIMVGYTAAKVLEVKVFMDQTTVVDFKLKEETIEIEEIEVIAERPVVERDVAASRANISYQEIESLPVSTITSVIGLQAGVEGMSFRGSGSDETAWIVNGMTLRDERNNAPVTNMSFTSVEEIQVQTGGFSAEFGNLRAGIINVITREGSKDRYSFNILSQYSPAASKHFGHAPNDPDSYWLRPYLDEAVSWTGTKNGAWPEYLRKQFPEFEGWNSIAAKTLQNNDPSDDLTPEGAQQLFLWQHRKDLNIQDPDYVFDMSFGGPVPYLNERLGNLRFHGSVHPKEDTE
jgi:outer membrane receptor protein involved in Fe transport